MECRFTASALLYPRSMKAKTVMLVECKMKPVGFRVREFRILVCPLGEKPLQLRDALGTLRVEFARWRGLRGWRRSLILHPRSLPAISEICSAVWQRPPRLRARTHR